MERDFLNLTPKRFLCPYCGQWHKLSKERSLRELKNYSLGLICMNAPAEVNRGAYLICFDDDYCYYATKSMCGRAEFDLNGKIKISSIVESVDKPIVTFNVPFTSAHDVGVDSCYRCLTRKICNLVKLGDEGNHRDMVITLGFEFELSDYQKISKAVKLAREEREVKKEATTMATNNILNMNMEFGPNKDTNIASTLMGIAVKNGESWRIYDKKKKEITDVGDMQLGNLPIFIMPTAKLNEGDLIKDGGEYYFVIKVAEGNTQTLCARTGEMKLVVPIKNVLGFSCYSKVIALGDSLNMGDDFDVENLAIMSAMCGQTGEGGIQMNQLLPLMLFKDKLGGEDDMKKMLLLSSMMNVPAEGSDPNAVMNQMLPLMLLKEKNGDKDDTMKKMLLASCMMGGNMADTNNPIMSYLMLEEFMGKKQEEQVTNLPTQIPKQASVQVPAQVCNQAPVQISTQAPVQTPTQAPVE